MSNIKKQKTTKNYRTVGEIICDLSLMLSPPENLSVSDAAEKYRYVNQPGAYVGKWLNSTVPYMIEPMDTFTSRRFVGMIFVGPAQCAKTDSLVLNTITYSVKVDPMDMIVFSPGMIEARAGVYVNVSTKILLTNTLST
jgi:phage terminase large subunit GpA-like protein